MFVSIENTNCKVIRLSLHFLDEALSFVVIGIEVHLYKNLGARSRDNLRHRKQQE